MTREPSTICIVSRLGVGLKRCWLGFRDVGTKTVTETVQSLSSLLLWVGLSDLGIGMKTNTKPTKVCVTF